MKINLISGLDDRYSHLKRLLLFFSLTLVFSFARLAIYGSEPTIWTTGTQADLLKGETRGVSVTDAGALVVAPRFSEIFNTNQTYVWSSTSDTKGNVYLGTGHDGKIFRIDSTGHGRLFYDAPELDITSLAVGLDNVVYAGASPDGNVYRITPDGKAEIYFDPPDKYIWSLCVRPDTGELIVGTGDAGKIYQVKTKGASAESSLLLDTDETNITALIIDRKKNIIAGTDTNGLVLQVSPEGKAFALFDSPLREIHALSLSSDGSIYVLALNEDSSGTLVSTLTAATNSPTTTVKSDDPSAAITALLAEAAKSQVLSSAAGVTPQRNDLRNARSAVYRLLVDGGTDIIWSSQTVPAFAVFSAPMGVYIGTGDRGRIYFATNTGRETLLLQSTEGQISDFVMSSGKILATSSNEGKLFLFDPANRDSPAQNFQGTYESIIRDAKYTARWGHIWWRGSNNRNVTLQTRTGNTERPDQTWSDWSRPYTDPNGAQITSPNARFIQWRALIRLDAKVEDVSIAYLSRNLAPEVTSITILPAGIGLQPQVLQTPDPNIEASGLEPSLLSSRAQVALLATPRRIYQKGALSLLWQSEDRNDDKLEFSVFYRALDETEFHLLKSKIREMYYTIDSAALADGKYVFRVVASDDIENPDDLAQTGEMTSELVVVDNTPPLVTYKIEQPGEQTKKRSGAIATMRVIFTVHDETGRIKHADLSIDGGTWNTLFPVDAIADSSDEIYIAEVENSGSSERTVSLRVFDSNSNVGSSRVVVR